MENINERLGGSTITFRHQTLAGALESIVATGLKKVDIACIPGFCPHINPLELTKQEELELKDRLETLGVMVSTLNVSAGGFNTDQKDFVVRFVEGAIDLAGRLDCYAITIPTGRKVSDPNLWDENAQISAECITSLANRAEQVGIQLTLEAPHTGTLTENVAETRRFYNLLGDPRVGNTFDTSHVARGNPVPVAKNIAEIGGPVAHVHFRDCIGENNHLTPGKGDVDFKAVVLKLESNGYQGDYIFELEGEDSQLAAGELSYAIQYISSLEF